MKRHILLALAAAGLAAPALAAGPTTVRTGSGDYLSRIDYAALKTADGRARLLAAVERSAAELCRDVHPRVDRRRCEAGTVAAAAGTAPPQVGAALRLAGTERQAVQMASR